MFLKVNIFININERILITMVKFYLGRPPAHIESWIKNNANPKIDPPYVAETNLIQTINLQCVIPNGQKVRIWSINKNNYVELDNNHPSAKLRCGITSYGNLAISIENARVQVYGASGYFDSIGIDDRGMTSGELPANSWTNITYVSFNDPNPYDNPYDNPYYSL